MPGCSPTLGDTGPVATRELLALPLGAGQWQGFGQRELPLLPHRAPCPVPGGQPGLWWGTALQAAPAPCARSSGPLSALTGWPRVSGQLGTGLGLSHAAPVPQSTQSCLAPVTRPKGFFGFFFFFSFLPCQHSIWLTDIIRASSAPQ